MDINVELVPGTAEVEVNLDDGGPPGYTPQRGVDYWTEADKQEIINEILAILGGAVPDQKTARLGSARLGKMVLGVQ